MNKQEKREVYAGLMFAEKFYHRKWSEYGPMTLLRLANVLRGYGTLRAREMGLYARRLMWRKVGESTCKEHLQ